MANRLITDYILRQRRTYTRDAIREALLRRGYRPEEVEEAFRAVESGEAPPAATLSGRFWLGYLGYIVLLYLLVVVAYVALAGASAAAVAGALAFFLVIGVIVSAVVAALNRSLALGMARGVAVAAIVPFLIVVVIGGLCVPTFARIPQ